MRTSALRSPPRCRSTSATREVPGSAAATKTPTAWSASTSQEEPTSRASPKRISMRLPCDSINVRERPWASKLQPINYKRCCTDRLNSQPDSGHTVVCLAGQLWATSRHHAVVRIAGIEPARAQSAGRCSGLFRALQPAVTRDIGREDGCQAALDGAVPLRCSLEGYGSPSWAWLVCLILFGLDINARAFRFDLRFDLPRRDCMMLSELPIPGNSDGCG